MLLSPQPDPFLQQMFSRMTPGAKFTFTPAQLDEIKKAFSARSFTTHDFDLRRSFSLFGKSYYLIVLAGRERRSVPRDRSARTIKAVTGFAIALACSLLFAAVL